MDVYKTHGAFSWAELVTSDPVAAIAFYGRLFGWTSEAMDMGGGSYHVVKAGDAQVAGVMAPPPNAPSMPPAWGCYVTVTDIDATSALCVELGGKILVPPMDVPGVGRMAVLQDPQGAVISAMTYSAN